MKLWDSAVSAYQRLLRQLLPRGAYWRTSDAEPTMQLLDAVATHLDHAHGQVYTVGTTEASPGTANLMLTAWEEALGLPEPGGDPLASTSAERRQVALGKFLASGGQTPAYYIELAAGLGLSATIAEHPYAPGSRAGIARAGTELVGADAAFEWFITITGAGAGPIPRLETLINKTAPAHTVVHFVYV
jgi:uncharacterized protein YmfQ (DUF2313 family)